MQPAPFTDEQIVESWLVNAEPWIEAVRDEQIESRTVCTNQAIVNTVCRYAPRTVLDVGCGEGWLARALHARGIQVIGMDIVPELIAAAQQGAGGDFRLLSYEDLAQGKLGDTVDAVVCNFSLIGKAAVEQLFQTIPYLLNPGGVFIVQTLHPLMACGTSPYADGWREGSWAGFSTAFTKPAPWYFRTLESWVQLFRKNGLMLQAVEEPIHPRSGKPASVVFSAKVCTC